MLERVIEVFKREGLGKRQRDYRLADIVELLDATHTAARAPGECTTALFKIHKTAAGKLDLHFEAVTDLHHVHAVNFLRALDNALGERKAHSEQLKIFWLGHHHDM
ncbi:hypothetical protein D3C76_1628730 [compost metagenome]